MQRRIWMHATLSCDGPEGALAVIQFLGIRSRQYGTQRGLFSTLAIYRVCKAATTPEHWLIL